MSNVQPSKSSNAQPSKSKEKGVQMYFATDRELRSFLRVGQYIQFCSPCVNRNNLDSNHPMVYEHCQLNKAKSGAQYFHCKRARGCRQTAGFVQSPERKRKRNIRGYVGCFCNAKITIRIDPVRGGFNAKFTGTHNHNVQTEMLNFLNPIQVCRTIREMVDTKLYTGIHKSGKIRQQIHDELLLERNNYKSHFQFRNFNMAIALETQDIINRRKQLCLDPDALLHKNDALAVEELIQTWHRDLGETSPVRYFKQVGSKNEDTDDTDVKSDFNSQDFLLIM